ncbi:MAG TPA: NHL repeat-containing protein, partial [Solirubrobacterales bacterium]|nr:NHL repeat-containing protein [Solirubrobacterales bacterium]
MFLALAAALCALALAAAPASASQARLFAGTFGAASSTTPDPYPLSKPWSVAVDESSRDVYVTDPGNHRVEKFDSEGNFVFTFGKEVNKTALEEARPEAEQNLCPAPGHLADVCQAGAPATTPGAFKAPEILFVAVDNSPTGEGDVYVADSSACCGSPRGADQVTKFDSEGHLVSAWASGAQLDGSAAPGGPFSQIAGIAVDPTGNLWVLGRAENRPRAFEFKGDAGFRATWSGASPFDAPAVQPTGLGVDGEDDTYFTTGPQLLKFGPTGERIGGVTKFGDILPSSVAVDPASGDLYVNVRDSFGLNFIQRYEGASCHPSGNEAPCEPAEAFGSNRLPSAGGPYSGLAVGPGAAHPLYVVGQNSGAGESGEITAFAIENLPDATTAKASGFTSTTATLNGTVNPSGEPLTECFFEWGETESYGETAPCVSPDAAEVGSGTSPVTVHAQIANLDPGATYHFRLVASNANTDLAEEPVRGADLAFGPPLIRSASALDVSATAATLQTEINPNNIATTYRFEYDTLPYAEGEAPHGTALPLPDGSLGSGALDVARSLSLTGLQPATTYHYRVIATNTLGAVETADQPFTTQPATASTALPDGRAYELVSPPDKHGTLLQGPSGVGGVIQAAADGSAIAYYSNAPITSDPVGNRSNQNSQFLARRGALPWSTEDISTPHQAAVGLPAGNPSEYKLFSPDLSLGAVEPEGATPLSPQATEKTPYLRQPGGEYTSLVNPANVSTGVPFGGEKTVPERFFGGVEFRTATPDLSHLLLLSPQPLTEDFKPSFPTDYTAKNSIYEWSAGALTLVSWVPTGPATACGGSGPACVPAAELGLTSAAGNTNDNLRGAISDDGSRVVFETLDNLGKHRLFLRDLAREETVQLDATQGGSGQSGSGVFEYASADGRRVFFTDANRLTTDSTAANLKPDLYMCEIEETPGLACDLTDLTANHLNPAEAADIQGAMIGASEDGNSLYFVAQGALTEGEGAVQGDCTGQGTGLCNLYRYDVTSEEVSLVAVLSGADSPDWFANAGTDLGQMTARVSPNGRYLAFMSERPLTGYDNRDAASGQPDEEVFLYDSGAPPAEALRCASCNPTGARPHGVLGPKNSPRPLVDGPGNWANRWTAASIPGWNRVDVVHALYQPRYLSDSGRLFFNSSDALLPSDTNGTQDVY